MAFTTFSLDSTHAMSRSRRNPPAGSDRKNAIGIDGVVPSEDDGPEHMDDERAAARDRKAAMRNGIDVGGIDVGGIPVTGRIVGIIVGTRVCDCIGGSDGVDDMESIAAVIRGPCPCICCCMGMDPPCAPARSACSIFTVGCTH